MSAPLHGPGSGPVPEGPAPCLWEIDFNSPTVFRRALRAPSTLRLIHTSIMGLARAVRMSLRDHDRPSFETSLSLQLRISDHAEEHLEKLSVHAGPAVFAMCLVARL